MDEATRRTRRARVKAVAIGAAVGNLALVGWVAAVGPWVPVAAFADTGLVVADSTARFALVPPALALWAIGFAAGALAWHRLVERPRRRGLPGGSLAVPADGWAAALVSLLASALVLVASGYGSRLFDTVLQADGATATLFVGAAGTAVFVVLAGTAAALLLALGVEVGNARSPRRPDAAVPPSPAVGSPGQEISSTS